MKTYAGPRELNPDPALVVVERRTHIGSAVGLLDFGKLDFLVLTMGFTGMVRSLFIRILTVFVGFEVDSLRVVGHYDFFRLHVVLEQLDVIGSELLPVLRHIHIQLFDVAQNVVRAGLPLWQ